jgi:hypothetical protein
MHRLNQTKRFADEYLVGKIFEQRICSPHRDIGLGKNRRRRSYLPSTQRGARDTSFRTAAGSREKKMQKMILMIAGSTLIALSTVQFAAASEHQNRVHHRTHTSFRDTNAYAAPAQQEWSGYGYTGGGMSAPAGH